MSRARALARPVARARRGGYNGNLLRVFVPPRRSQGGFGDETSPSGPLASDFDGSPSGRVCFGVVSSDPSPGAGGGVSRGDVRGRHHRSRSATPAWAAAWPTPRRSSIRCSPRASCCSAAGEPIVVVALDWCQCNNDSYDRWRDVLAEAAGTTPQRVMLATVHQHDAPICDLTAQKLLDQHGLKGYNCDPEFHETGRAADGRGAEAGARRVAAPGDALRRRAGQGRAGRLESPRGRARTARSLGSAAVPAATSTTRPRAKSIPGSRRISLWDGDRPVLAWSCYAVHPMSYYGKGSVSADFPGMARARRQKDDPERVPDLLHRLRGRHDGRQVQHGRAGESAGARRPALSGHGGGVEGHPARSRSSRSSSAWPSCAAGPRAPASSPIEAMQTTLADPKADALAADLRRAGAELAQARGRGPAGRRAVPRPGRRRRPVHHPAGRELRRLPARGPEAAARLASSWWPASATARPATSPPTSAGATATTTTTAGCPP